jgi:hypothetical protein
MKTAASNMLEKANMGLLLPQIAAVRRIRTTENMVGCEPRRQCQRRMGKLTVGNCYPDDKRPLS